MRYYFESRVDAIYITGLPLVSDYTSGFLCALIIRVPVAMIKRASVRGGRNESLQPSHMRDLCSPLVLRIDCSPQGGARG